LAPRSSAGNRFFLEATPTNAHQAAIARNVIEKWDVDVLVEGVKPDSPFLALVTAGRQAKTKDRIVM